MAGGIVINGRFVARPGVYASFKYITTPSAPTQGGSLAVVGEFPFLQQNVPHLSTTKRAFDALAPANATLRRMSNIIYAPLINAPFAGAPAEVYLISTVPTTQAFGNLYSAGAVDSIKVSSAVWGPEGNQTRFRIVPNVASGGWDVVVANNGVQENIRVPAEPAPAVIAYAYPVAIPGAPGAAPHTTEGFGVWLDDTGSTTSGAVTASGVELTFSKVLDQDTMDVDAAAHVSWLPSGPVRGVLNVATIAGGVLSVAATLSVSCSGVNSVTGLNVVEVLTFSVAECLDGAVKTTTTAWSSLTSVSSSYTAAGTFTGTISIAGANFAPLNEAGGQTTIAEVLAFLEQYAAAGFTSTTASTRTTSIDVADLDYSASAPLSLTLTADKWKILTTVNASSIMVVLTSTGNLAPAIPTAGTFFYLVGGSQSAVTALDWADALEELRWYDVDDVCAFYDPTGTAPAADTILPYFKAHSDTMWADGANERLFWFGAGDLDPLSTLVARAALFNSERSALVIDAAYIPQFTGAVERQTPHWYALMHAAASASLLRVGTLTRANTRVTATQRNAGLYTNEVVNELLRAGCILTTTPPGGTARIEREVTTWTKDTNVARTEVVATRSVRDSTKAMRIALDGLLAPGGDPVTDGALKVQVRAQLEAQTDSLNPLIHGFEAESITVARNGDILDVGYTIIVRIDINFIRLFVGITVPASAS